MKKKRLIGLLSVPLVLALALSLGATALAQPPAKPHRFWGTVIIEGKPVGAGVTVSAEIDHVPYESGVTDAQGRYGVDPDDLFYVPSDDPGTPEKDGGINGDEVVFKVNEVEATETVLRGLPTFESGGGSEINLTVGEIVDVTPPTVESTTPTANATGVAIDAEVSANFSEEIQPGYYFGDIAISGDTGGATIDGTTLTIPHDAFAYEETYEVTIPAGAVEDIAGNTLAEAKVWSFTVVAEPEPEPEPIVGGGGGGGGGPRATYTDTDLFGTDKNYRISSDGKILVSIEATSADGMLTMTIRKGTIALGKDGKRLANLETAVDESPPDPPEDTHVIGLAYDFGPAGATFDPAITLTWRYDPRALPEGVALGDLVVAYYDGAAWVELDCVVDTKNYTIRASVEHFTCFAIIGAVTPPEEEEVVVVEEEEVVVVEEEEVVVVEEEEVVVVEEEEVVPAKPSIDWTLVGGIIGAVVVIGLLVAFFLIRRRRRAATA